MPRDSAIDTPTKAKISRRFQQLGGDPGAATSTAREFGLGSNGCTRVKKYDQQIAAGTASRKFKGRISRFNSDLEGDIEEAFADDDTQTYREVCEKLGLPKTTLYRYATEVMDYRCLDQTVRPMPSAGRSREENPGLLHEGREGECATKTPNRLRWRPRHGSRRGHV